MPCLEGTSYQSNLPLCILTKNKESCPDFVPFERLQNGFRMFGVGAVIKRQPNAFCSACSSALILWHKNIIPFHSQLRTA
jgi:hypothetical protein